IKKKQEIVKYAPRLTGIQDLSYFGAQEKSWAFFLRKPCQNKSIRYIERLTPLKNEFSGNSPSKFFTNLHHNGRKLF
ncbi:hypothetical protein, partial [Turicimonas muris]|uniref:hypothetical protein n=1 Tax=Turicimonas muris TaxID=1796652 RepID=UPI002674A9C6